MGIQAPVEAPVEVPAAPVQVTYNEQDSAALLGHVLHLQDQYIHWQDEYCKWIKNSSYDKYDPEYMKLMMQILSPAAYAPTPSPGCFLCHRGQQRLQQTSEGRPLPLRLPSITSRYPAQGLESPCKDNRLQHHQPACIQEPQADPTESGKNQENGTGIRRISYISYNNTKNDFPEGP